MTTKNNHNSERITSRLAFVLLALLLCLQGCSSDSANKNKEQEAGALDTSRFLRIVNDEPDTADPQCTEKYFDIALNVFDRLVETRIEPDGTISFVPSLADSWEISDDGLVYTFHLHEARICGN